MSILTYAALGVALPLAAGGLWTRKLAREAVETVPQPGKLEPVEGGVMHYVDTGPRDGPHDGPRDGVTLVLIHGIAGQLQHFTYAMVDLLQDEFRVIAVDRPGCGYSTVTDGDGASLGDQARMIDALLDKIGVDNAVLVGHSLGGAVALRMALDFPTRVAGLAMLCPLTQAQPEVPGALKGLNISTPWLRQLLGGTIAVPIAKLTADKVLAEVFSPEQCPADFLERAGAFLGLRPQAFVAACSDLTAVQMEMPAQAARYETELTVPGGILYGADDSTLSVQAHGQSMTSHGLSCETLAGRGHMIPITAPQECADFVRLIVAKVQI
jgi:pimeloyl-ACP methyl ester carboxylesterase